MTAMLFPASLYSLAIRFQSIDLIDTEKTCFFAIRGYSLTDKEIRSVFKQEAEEYSQQTDRPFSKRVIRKVEGHWEIINCINAALFTVLVVPKKIHFRSDASKLLLYYNNFELIEGSLNRCEKELDSLEPSQTEAICEKANTIRRSMETLLKIECCYRDVSLKKDYSKARLGDLWGVLRKYHSEQISILVSKFIEWVNELSHDTGRPIDKSKADFTLTSIKLYLQLFKKEVHTDFRYPRLRWNDEDQIAF